MNNSNQNQNISEEQFINTFTEYLNGILDNILQKEEKNKEKSLLKAPR